MEIIRSNPWGFRIHSPFVYQLVTRGLYRKLDRAKKKLAYPESFSAAERKCARQILNLIRFLQPEKGIVSGEDDPLHEWIIDQSRQRRDDQPETGYKPTIPCRRIILWSGMPQVMKAEHFSDVWVILGMKSKRDKTICDFFKQSDEVRVILESYFLVIFFFHPLLQKKHYIIHRWFYL
jgi:hypothetical protein